MKDFSVKKIYEMITHMIDLNNKKILEIGCGNGEVTFMLSAHTDSITAIDPNSDSIGEALKNYTDIDFRVGSGEDTGFKDSTFDIVIFTRSLHHQNSYKSLKEAERITHDRGRVVVIEPVIGGEFEEVCRFIDDEDQDKLNAQSAVHNSSMTVVNDHDFEADVEFDDKNELYQWFQGYYNKVVTDDIKSKIESEFSHKINVKPLRFTDLNRIQLLRRS